MVELTDAGHQHYFGTLGSTAKPLDLDEIVKAWAGRILYSGAKGMTRNQRQVLHDICRPDRVTFRRSALARLLELAPFASPGDAVFGAELLRGEILGRLDFTVPTVDTAYEQEGLSNFRANLAQERFRENPTHASCEHACEMLVEQILSSRIAADASWASMQRRRALVVASR